MELLRDPELVLDAETRAAERPTDTSSTISPAAATVQAKCREGESPKRTGCLEIGPSSAQKRHGRRRHQAHVDDVGPQGQQSAVTQ